MLKLIKLAAVITGVLMAASYGLYILTDPVNFLLIVFPALLAFSLAADWVAGYLYVRQQRKIAASIDTRILNQYKRKQLLRTDNG